MRILILSLGGFVVAFLIYANTVSTISHKKAENEVFVPEIIQDITDSKSRVMLLNHPVRSTMTGSYLASHHAQTSQDWGSAKEYLSEVLPYDETNPELIKRLMVLSVGSGAMDDGTEYARDLIGIEPEDNLALLVLTIDALKRQKADEAIAHIEKMPHGDMTGFVRPILHGWAGVMNGTLVDDDFSKTGVHYYHYVLMAIMLDKNDIAMQTVDEMLSNANLTFWEIERAADLYAALGETDKAKGIYAQLSEQAPHVTSVADKMAALDDAKAIKPLLRSSEIETPKDGAAEALYDMAFILYQEQSVSSTRLFSYMALALRPDLINARLLLADSLIQAMRYDDAIDQLSQIPEDHKTYIETRRYMADLKAEMDDMDGAKRILKSLYDEYDDVESLIKIGDLHRQNEDYEKALKVYNQAANAIGDITQEHWNLYYARGMALERLGKWKKAEADLKAALAYQPDHPYILNYLGYGWADQGINLDEAFAMIKKALEIRPNDGYITDSLGWVYYMTGKYEAGLPYLERAVELLPYDPTINDHLGDVYWKVGRYIEAKYQWKRALNHADEENDAALEEEINKKLLYGLQMEKAEIQFEEKSED